MSPQIVKEYVDTGKVRLVFRNFAFLSQESLWAAEATYCADEQGKVWEFKDKVFASTQALTRENLKSIAKDAGLDSAAFNACYDSGKYAAQVTKDNNFAEQSGLTGTPSFLINGKLYGLQGNEPNAWLTNFRKTLDAELAK